LQRIYVIDDIVLANGLPLGKRYTNAHSRRIMQPDAKDVIVRARSDVASSLERCLPIGEYREKAYRVRPDISKEWGGLSVKNGYLQRSARLPRFLDPERFQSWFNSKNPVLLQKNN
jgi:hypothetical protein